MDPFAFGPAASNALTNFVSFAHALRRERRADAEAASVPAEGALAAQLAFQQATVMVLHRLSYLSGLGMPPPLRGAFWSWPAAYRVARDFHQGVEVLHVTFAAAMTLSPEGLAQPTNEAFEAIGKVVACFAAQGHSGEPEFKLRIDEAYDRLGAHSAAVKLLIAAQHGSPTPAAREPS